MLLLPPIFRYYMPPDALMLAILLRRCRCAFAAATLMLIDITPPLCDIDIDMPPLPCCRCFFVTDASHVITPYAYAIRHAFSLRLMFFFLLYAASRAYGAPYCY